MLPVPPTTLAFAQITLRFGQMLPGEPSRGLVPAYHFRILAPDGSDAGHLNFRVGDTPHILLCAGHIGFEVQPPFRGHHYAEQACRAVAPFVRTLYHDVIITCDPENHASRRTIERLEASFIDEVRVPPEDPQYQRGSRSKRRYHWVP